MIKVNNIFLAYYGAFSFCASYVSSFLKVPIKQTIGKNINIWTVFLCQLGGASLQWRFQLRQAEEFPRQMNESFSWYLMLCMDVCLTFLGFNPSPNSLIIDFCLCLAFFWGGGCICAMVSLNLASQLSFRRS